MDRNHLQPNPNYNAAFIPNPAPNAGQQQAQAQGEPVPPLGDAPGLHAHPQARNLQAYNAIHTPQGWVDSWNWQEYQPIKPEELGIEKLADEAENTRRMERSLKHAQECEADGDLQDAEEAYAKALRYTENAEHYKLYAGCLRAIYLNLSRIPLTLEKDVAKEKEYKEKAARTFYYLGDLYQKQGNWQEAQAAYQASCDLALYEVPLKALVDVARQIGETGDIVDALEKLADLYAGKGRIDLAIERLKEAFEVGKVARILEKLEALHAQVGGEDSQFKINEIRIHQFELQISQDPKNIGLYRQYVWFLKDIGRRNEARAVKKRMDGLSQAMQHKIVKQKTKIRDLEQTIQFQDGKLESLEKQIEFLGKQVTHLDCSHWPDMRDADFISLLKKNPSLQCLSLDGCAYLTDAVLDILPAYFENLQELNLRGCEGITAAGLDAIAENATQLRRLILDHCPATTIILLHKLNAKGIAFTIEGVIFEKKQLNLYHRKDTLTDAGLLKELEENPEITELILGDCTKITDAGLAPLKNFQWLTYLNLFRCGQITDAGLQHLVGLTQLTNLNLNWCHQITDTGLQYLAGMTKLTDLGSHSFNQVTDAGLQHLSGLTQLKSLILHNFPKITDEGLRSLDLKRFTQLEALSLYNCKQITEVGFRELLGLPQLKTLCVHETCITDAGLSHLSGLTQLTYLTLYNCKQITDAGLQHLVGLTQLKKLDLRGCTQLSSNAKEDLKRKIPGLTIEE